MWHSCLNHIRVFGQLVFSCKLIFSICSFVLSRDEACIVLHALLNILRVQWCSVPFLLPRILLTAVASSHDVFKIKRFSFHIFITIKSKSTPSFSRCNIWCGSSFSVRVSMGTPCSTAWSCPKHSIPNVAERCQCCRLHQLPRQCSVQILWEGTWDGHGYFQSVRLPELPSKLTGNVEVNGICLFSINWWKSGSDLIYGWRPIHDHIYSI